MSEKQPLTGDAIIQANLKRKREDQKKLGMISGVTIPCTLSLFNAFLFLRLGLVLGQVGFLVSMGMLLIAYVTIVTTVFAISAIATSANVEKGGVYYLISRSLGPEFGGAAGAIFYVANLFGCASYIIGVVEVVTDSIGVGGTFVKPGQGLPVSYWYEFLYGTIFLLFCLAICIIGAKLFARTSTVIVIIVFIALGSSMFSFGFVETKLVPWPRNNPFRENSSTLLYTSWSWDTFQSNLQPSYTIDYSRVGKGIMNFQYVFAILFNGCIGVMSGVNISGNLKNPSKSIPEGTLLALVITFCTYTLLFTFSSFTCSRQLLVNNYYYLSYINVAGPIITVGVFVATLSAALTKLIGTSKVLHAIADDRLFGNILHPLTLTLGKAKEPFMAVLLSWLIAQLLLFMHRFNTIAPFTATMTLLSYASVNLSCFILSMTSAPNFRPTFKVNPKVASAIGFLSCLTMMFLIDAIYSAVAIALLLIIIIYLLIRGPAKPWGEVSQAIIYHQVRKFLLRLDIRKSHVRFWRPEVLLLVSNPRSAYHLIEFTNDLKKGGLYVLGHVIPTAFNSASAQYYSEQLQTWLNFVDVSNVKAFSEITICSSIRIGVQNLLAIAGLGGMKPNTLVLGFYSRDLPVNTLDTLHRRLLRKRSKVLQYIFRDNSLEKFAVVDGKLPSLRKDPQDQELSAEEYVSLIQDGVTMGKNVCVMRHFETFDKSVLKARPFIDVWPLNITRNGELDNTCLLMLQLACILHMKNKWKATSIRVFLIDANNVRQNEQIIHQILADSRIEASVHVVDPAYANQCFTVEGQTTFMESLGSQNPSTEFYTAMNSITKQYSQDSSLIFTALPTLPCDQSEAEDFVKSMDILSGNTGPIVMVHGTTQVMMTLI